MEENNDNPKPPMQSTELQLLPDQELEEVGRKNKPNTIIDSYFGEILFKLWAVGGKTFADLVRIYRGTPRQFAMDTIRQYSHRHRWADRKQKMLEEAQAALADDFVVQKSEQMKMLHQVITLTAHHMDREMREYLKDPTNPRKRPSWIPRTIKELGTLIRDYDFVASGGVEKHKIDGASKGFDADMSDEVAAKMLQMLSEAATQKLIQQSLPPPINAEFTVVEEESEAPVEDENLAQLMELAKKNDK